MQATISDDDILMDNDIGAYAMSDLREASSSGCRRVPLPDRVSSAENLYNDKILFCDIVSTYGTVVAIEETAPLDDPGCE